MSGSSKVTAEHRRRQAYLYVRQSSLKQVYEHHPDTVRIILTGFADSDATIQAINDGHIYAYVNKPWEPDELKQLVKRAVDHHQLTVENRRLLDNLSHANSFLEAVMDDIVFNGSFAHGTLCPGTCLCHNPYTEC